MSRETEKLLKELQRFLDANTDEAVDETTVNALAEQFLAEYDQKCADQKDFVPETADDYLRLAEQAPSKKKHMEYLRKARSIQRTQRPILDSDRNQTVYACVLYIL